MSNAKGNEENEGAQTGARVEARSFVADLEERLKGRILLDYPMDVLLDRSCRLVDYENGIISNIREFYERERKKTSPSPALPDALKTQLKSLSELDPAARGKPALGALRFPTEDSAEIGRAHV